MGWISVNSDSYPPNLLTNYVDAVMNSNPYAYYRMSNGTMNDYSGNARHGTTGGTITWGNTSALTNDGPGDKTAAPALVRTFNNSDQLGDAQLTSFIAAQGPPSNQVVAGVRYREDVSQFYLADVLYQPGDLIAITPAQLYQATGKYWTEADTGFSATANTSTLVFRCIQATQGNFPLATGSQAYWTMYMPDHPLCFPSWRPWSIEFLVNATDYPVALNRVNFNYFNPMRNQFFASFLLFETASSINYDRNNNNVGPFTSQRQGSVSRSLYLSDVLPTVQPPTLDAGSSITAGWHHVAITNTPHEKNSTQGSRKLYINGQSVSVGGYTRTLQLNEDAPGATWTETPLKFFFGYDVYWLYQPEVFSPTPIKFAQIALYDTNLSEAVVQRHNSARP